MTLYNHFRFLFATKSIRNIMLSFNWFINWYLLFNKSTIHEKKVPKNTTKYYTKYYTNVSVHWKVNLYEHSRVNLNKKWENETSVRYFYI